MRCSFIRSRFLAACGVVLLASSTLIGVGSHAASAATVTQFDLLNPAGAQVGSQFGPYVTVLPNGNIVVIDSSYDRGATADVGAVYLFNGTTRALISTLTGTSTGDAVGGNGVVVLSNGNFVVRSPSLDNGSATDAGAVTWGSGTTGVNGAVSAANSLVGTTSHDTVGSDGTGRDYVVGLPNGNYLVRSPNWDNGTAVDAGAVTWGNGVTGTAGAVSVANSLVGTTSSDNIGGVPLVVPDAGSGVFVLPNSNYVVTSRFWDNGTVVDAGAATWGNGATGTSGAVSVANSLVGTTLNDNVGGFGVVVLSNGNYLVESLLWDNGMAIDAGAVTWGNAATGVRGVLSAANSLVGSTSYDLVGYYGVYGLKNGNYVVASHHWHNGAAVDAGAVTWGSGTVGVKGTISASNSLVGTASGDDIGYSGVFRLPNGNYVVSSKHWDNGAAVDAGAVTWGSGTAGVKGSVTVFNSLVGSTSNDNIGDFGVYALSNSNFVVMSSTWDNGATVDAGAATWGDGTTGVSGAVSASNSLVGTSSHDNIGMSDVTELPNGNYVVSSQFWNNGAAMKAGAVTWGNGTTGVKGAVSASNSLVGTTSGDRVGSFSDIVVLSNGNYLVGSPLWSNGAASNAGAVTLANGATGVKGAITSSNSLVGTTTDDYVGGHGIYELPNGNYIIHTANWDNGSVVDAGAVTWVSGTGAGVIGPITASNSLIGTTSGDGRNSNVDFANGNYLLLSPSWDNGSSVDAGAVTWGSGATGLTGTISAANSLVGTKANDNISSGGIAYLTTGNYVLASPNWDNGSVVDAGAVTWGNAAMGIRGAVTAANSLVGTTANDNVGAPAYLSVIPNDDGSYIVFSGQWDNGSAVDAGAVTYSPATGITGPITASNSAIGTPPGMLGRIVGRSTSGAYVTTSSQNRVVLMQVAELTWVDQTVAGFQAGVPYSDAVSATGNAPATYTVSAGALPAGVTLNAATGALTGTPTTPGSYSFTMTASSSASSPITASFTGTVAAAPVTVPPSEFVALSPGRLADTRPAGVTVDGLFAAGGARAAGSTFELPVAGRGGVPADARSVSLNITAVDPTSDGYATVYPCGGAVPNASNLNYTAGHNLAGGVITKIGSGGKVCIYVSAATQLIVDVNGSFPANSSLVSSNPARVLDTRPTGATVDALQQAGGLRASGSTTTVTIAGRANIPADAKAVAVTVTATGPAGNGYLTVYPCGTAMPNSSNLNYTAGSDMANLVISKLGTSGSVCVYTSAATHLIVDVTGYFPAGSTYEPLQPARLLETRTGSATIDNLFNGSGVRPAETVTEVIVTGRGGVAANAATVVLNVTATGSTADGFVSVYPCGIAPPNASNLNFAAGKDQANTVITKVGTGGKVCLYNSAPTHLIADVNGYLTN
jgi:Repeat of unknown function (DUF5650)/Putative Ig domain